MTRTNPWKIKIVTIVFVVATLTFFFLLYYRLIVVVATPTTTPTTITTTATKSLEETASLNKEVAVNSIDETISYSNHKHFFDCDHENSLCTYFTPNSFFENDGKSFVQDNDQWKSLGGKNPNLPALTGFAAPSLPEKYSYLPSTRLTFVHIHKCGGTSVKATMSRLAKKIPGASVTQYKYSFGGGSAQMKEANRRARNDYIEGLTPKQDVVFTIVRDPIERFLSAVQQVMHYNDELRDLCLDASSARKTIQCAINDAREHSFRGDVHLLPMVSHFRLLDYVETSIAIFPMRNENGNDVLSMVLRQLGSRGQQHARDRTNEQYATSQVLSSMSVKDCTPAMVTAICNLYEIDVVLLKYLGFRSPNCT